MRTSTRRLGAVVATTALASGGLLIAPAEATNDYSSSSSGWLAGQLRDGIVYNGQYDFEDYGLSLDIFFALKAVGTRPGAAASVIDAMAGKVSAYTGSGTERYAGAIGKLATAVKTAGRNPASFGGVNLVVRLQNRIHTAADPQHGRGVDHSTYGDSSNTIGQSYVVRALTGAGSPLADEARSFLLKQQCAAGYFRESMAVADGSYSCDGASTNQGTPSVDTTALVVEALTAARDRGVTGLEDDIADASAWLARQQADDGSFTGNDTPNTNTTGLAATALALTGRSAAAERAGAWISRREVTPVRARNNSRLAHAVGAIAYDSAALAAGKREGITRESRDQWRRATAQAVIGVDAVRSLRVTVPTGFVRGGSTMDVAISGLAPSEGWLVRLRGVPGVDGDAASNGTATAHVALPRRTHTYAVTALGTSSERTGTSRVRVLGPTTPTTSFRSNPIAPGRNQRVTVGGLARGESVRLYYRGDLVWSGEASVRGRVAHSFPVGSSTGRRKVHVRGEFSDRVTTTSFRVAR